MARKGYISHHIEKRTRVYLPSERGNAQLLSEIADKLSGHDEVIEVIQNPLTGSLLILHELSLEELLEYARAQEIFEVDPSLSEEKNWAEDLLEKLNNVDRKIIEATEGDMNLASLVALGLLGAGAYQISRRQLFPAASSLIADSMRVLVQIYRSPSFKEKRMQYLARSKEAASASGPLESVSAEE